MQSGTQEAILTRGAGYLLSIHVTCAVYYYYYVSSCSLSCIKRLGGAAIASTPFLPASLHTEGPLA